MEMVLDRQISDQRVYPAIDIFKSGTRREELLLPAYQLDKINMIRRGLAGHRPVEAIERLLSSSLGLKPRQVRIVGGATSKRKIVDIDLGSLADVRQLLAHGVRDA